MASFCLNLQILDIKLILKPLLFSKNIMSTENYYDNLWLCQKLEINPPIITQNSEWVPEPIDLNIVYEDDSILVLNKQSGLVVHPGAGNPNGTLLNGLIQYCPSLIKIPRAGLVHRLDKDTTGLLVVAKTLESHTSLVNQLLERQVSRVYIAVSWGRLKTKMEINKSLARDKYNRKKFSVSDSSFAKKSQTDIKPISYGKIESYPVSVIECKLKTGRTHLMDATPVTLGQVFGGYASQIAFSQSAIDSSIKSVGYLPIGGTAVGSGINAPNNFGKDVANELEKSSLLNVAVSKSHSKRIKNTICWWSTCWST